MDGAKFAKFCRETKIKSKAVSSTEIDITFARVKAGGRQINYDQFIAALRHLATRRFPKKDEDAAFAALKKLIAKSQGPATTGATVADTSGVYSKFTDESGYTGAHAARFADVPKHAGNAAVDAAVARAEALEAEARAAFAKYDTNRSSTIEEAELTALLADFGFDTADVHNEYEAAGGHGDGIDFEHFVTYFNKLKARKHGKARRARKAGGDVKLEEGEAPPPAESVQQVFLRFCAFGGNTGAKVMDNKTFAKLCKDTRLVHKKNKRFTTTDVDLIFAKVKAKGKRKITFSEFETALSAIAAKLYPKLGSEEALHNVEDQIIAGGGPSSSGTKAMKGGIVGHLTDTSQYTGAHKARFDKDGHGRGAAGRRSNDKVGDLSQITRANLN